MNRLLVAAAVLFPLTAWPLAVAALIRARSA
jgi:hypothetical protein